MTSGQRGTLRSPIEPSRTHAANSRPPPDARIAVELALLEGRHLLRHPLIVVGMLLGVWLVWATARDVVPVIPHQTAAIGGALLPLAAATFVVVSRAVLRIHRDEVAELADSAPTRSVTRVRAHLLSVLWPAGLAALVALASVGYFYLLGGIGTPDLAELLTGPVVVAISGLIAVALAAWLRSSGMAVVVLVVLSLTYAAGLAASAADGGGTVGALRWLAPWVPAETTAPPALVIRPTGGHLLYLAGIGALAGTLAVLRHDRARGAVTVAALAAVLTIAGAGTQARAFTGATAATVVSRVTDQSAAQRCDDRDGVRYCAFAPYDPWRSRWDRVVRGVLRQVPDQAHPRPLVLRQWSEPLAVLDQLDPSYVARAGNSNRPRPPDAHAALGLSWGRGSAAGVSELRLGLDLARDLVGLPRRYTTATHTPSQDPAAADDPRGDPMTERLVTTGACTAGGQAREVVALWLAAQATPGTRSTFRAMTGDALPAGGAAMPGTNGDALPALGDVDERSGVAASPVAWSRTGSIVAARLLERDPEAVADVLRRSWRRWIAPSTSAAELADAMGVPVSAADAPFPFADDVTDRPEPGPPGCR